MNNINHSKRQLLNTSAAFLLVTLFGLCNVSCAGNSQAPSSIQQANQGIRDHSEALYPYQAVQSLRKHLDDTQSIVTLLQQYSSVPAVRSLYRVWARKTFTDGNYQTLISNYYDTNSEELSCVYRSAQLALGNRSEAFDDITPLWMSASSVSDFCDPVFAAWAPAQKPQNIIDRAILTYQASNFGLTRHLAEKLPAGSAQNTLLAFTDFADKPETILDASTQQLTGSKLSKALLPTALAQLVRKDSVRYAAFAMKWNNVLQGSPTYEKLLVTLTGYLANRGNAQALQTYDLIDTPSRDTQRALIRSLVLQRNWREIDNRISESDNDAMALYWLARAREALGKDAQSAYRKAAQTRSYYGFLAADKAGKNYQFNNQPISPNSATQAQLNGQPALIRAKLLRSDNDSYNARREILFFAKKRDKAFIRQLAYWLSSNAFHFEAIYLLGKERDWNSLDIRFPTPYTPEAEHAEQQTGVDLTWIYAIIRQESSMNPYAQSHAKAQGLMQLIPSTAKLMATQQNLSLEDKAIFDPTINTELGAAYLASMFERFNSIAFASAAYNAGPARVDRWQYENADDMTIWIESIPFTETRKYVKNILEYQQVYANALGKSIPSVTQRVMGDYNPVTK